MRCLGVVGVWKMGGGGGVEGWWVFEVWGSVKRDSGCSGCDGCFGDVGHPKGYLKSERGLWNEGVFVDGVFEGWLSRWAKEMECFRRVSLGEELQFGLNTPLAQTQPRQCTAYLLSHTWLSCGLMCCYVVSLSCGLVCCKWCVVMLCRCRMVWCVVSGMLLCCVVVVWFGVL